MLDLLDHVLFRRPFEGRSARRYAQDERPAFGDLDERLLDGLGLDAAQTLLDVGCGPGTFARRAAARHPALRVIALDPSATFADRPGARLQIIRARAEALPLADRSIDVAVCVSSIRHVRDRAASLRELRRVVCGRVVIIELDPAASARRTRAHADRLATWPLRWAFGPLVLRTAPPASKIAALARAAGFTVDAVRDDPVQPVYVMELR